MIFKRSLIFVAACLAAFSSGLTRENIKPPTYYKSSVSTRFLQSVNTQLVDHEAAPAKTSATALRSLVPDTLRMLALRVQFQRDNDRNTTGDGWFDMSEVDSVMINPPPHDHLYFTLQLRALKDYFEKVSHGKLILEVLDENGAGNVFPGQNEDPWTLPNPMAYYNPNTTDEELDVGLAELFRDAIVIADSNSDITFSEYDVFIIFHAGVGWEFTQDFDTTPSDIPSVFLNINDLGNALGDGMDSFEGIPVNDGTHFIKEGIILPETENQGGNSTFGMLGTAAIMMGHQLGLPNLFDTDTGHPGIGRFGLMDQGSGSFLGLIPVQPCAWSKIFLGWEEPIEITSGTDIPVAASLAKNPNKIYKIPINSREYFLIENRQRTVLKSRDVAIGYDAYGVQVEFTNDGEINLPIGTERLDVITSIDEYDFGLPAYDTGTGYQHSGILIWHIDENVIEKHFEENRVNADMYHRGVDLVEADGAQDMGHFFNFFGITGYESGGAFDMWWDENSDHFYANSSEIVAFTPTTMPNSNSHAGANSGIYITDFSPVDSIMYFTLNISHSLTGFPAYTGPNSGTSSPVVGDLDGDGTKELIASSEYGVILAWKQNGDKFISNEEETFLINVAGDTTTLPLAVFAEIDSGRFSFVPSLADLNNDGTMEVVAGADNGWLYSWYSIDNDGDGRADPFFKFECGSPITTEPVIGDWSRSGDAQEILVGLESGEICYFRIVDSAVQLWQTKVSDTPIHSIADLPTTPRSKIVAIDASNSLFILDHNGEVILEKSLSNFGALNHPAIADLDSDDAYEIVLSTLQGDVIVLDDNGEMKSSFSVVKVTSPLSNPAIGDTDNNGYPEIVLTGGGKIFAFHHNGALLTDFPVEIERGYEQSAYPDPVLVDLEGDGNSEIITGTKAGLIVAYDISTKKITDFPLSVSAEIASSPAISGFTESGKFHLFARSTDDYVYVWQLQYDYHPDQVHWGEYLNNARHSSLYSIETPRTARQGDLMPEKMVYNYPNPTEGNSTTIRYYLRDAANVSIRIYDMSGELVDELAGTGYADVENEVIWNITDVQSGVYLARVAAEGSGETNAAIIKIAVVK